MKGRGLESAQDKEVGRVRKVMGPGQLWRDANLKTPEARALEEWLAENGLDDDEKRIDVLYEALYAIQHGERFAKTIKRLLDAATSRGIDGATQDFAELINDFAGNMRLRVNNGHTAREMLEMTKSDRPKPFMLKVNNVDPATLINTSIK